MLGINAAYSLKMEVTHKSSGFVVVFLWKGLFFILMKTEKLVYEYKIEKEGRNGSDKYERGGKRGG